jgi:hypothetical protein
MTRLIQRFLHGLAVNRTATAGAVVVTTATISFLLFEMLHVSGVVTNTYIGLILYLALPSLFLLGLLLIPLGIQLEARRMGYNMMKLVRERFADEDLKARETGSRLVRTVTLLTLANLIFVMAAGGRALHFMDSAEFCGTACHSVMNPEWTTYQQSPHARVACVECHVGEGVGALIDSKLNGAWQVVSATFDLFERPIPTPVHQLRPARETCETCHWPDMFHGQRIRHFVEYELDSLNTARYSTLVMKIGTGELGVEQGSHWHISEANEDRYASVKDERERMLWVEAKRPDGSWVRYESRSLKGREDLIEDRKHSARTMDCVDCHNRATHIYERPENAVDSRMQMGEIDRSLPFVKRVVLEAILGSHGPDKIKTLDRVEHSVAAMYRRNWPDLLISKRESIEQAGRVARSIVERNLHPGMSIDWNAYPSHLGHNSNLGGCFRCHNNDLVSEEGGTIPDDCTLCHGILALDADAPFKALENVPGPDVKDRTAPLRRYLKSEYAVQDAASVKE